MIPIFCSDWWGHKIGEVLDLNLRKRNKKNNYIAQHALCDETQVVRVVKAFDSAEG